MMTPEQKAARLRQATERSSVATARTWWNASPESARLRAAGADDLDDATVVERYKSHLREEYIATAAKRRDDIIKTVTDPAQRAVLLQKFDDEFARSTAEGVARREDELRGLFGGRKRKTRKHARRARHTRRR